ncbi:polyisoprenoid-binding protein [Kribbella turkmenica]|uniref:Polyisoprenoid-binding protein n=1 Tax=Kribbella turkmenica TaxID=2530375 RepID=A0A4R4XI18_9ACTN|nr:YceI family protein [Kribbella turkmenica]TDD30434.1 polyisoprenoid-binding protein [Kribbella turkmenica]
MASEYAALTGDYTIDTAHSRVGFVARHAMVTKVRGSFNEFEGFLHLDGENPENSSGRVTIQAKSIDTRNSQRDDHLRSNDFLDMDNHAEITFASTAVKHNGGADFTVVGDLTVRGVTKSVEIPFEYTGSATDPFGNQRVGLEGSVVINRKDFGVNWNAALETGGVLVSEKVTLEIEVSAIRNS